MAIPIGTTARQLGAILRWMLVSIVAVGMLMWWWPGYSTWGGLTVGLLAIWALWLTWKTIRQDRWIAGHPLYWALAGPAVILCWHFGETGLTRSEDARLGIGGALNASMIFQLLLLSLGMLLVQSLLSVRRRRPVIVAVCGLAMIVGPGAAVLWSSGAGRGPGGLGLVVLAGVFAWLAGGWPPKSDVQARDAARRWYREIRTTRLSVAAAALALLIWRAPVVAVVGAGVVGVTVALAGAALGGRRWLLGGGVLAIVAVSLPAMAGASVFSLRGIPIHAIGYGERGLTRDMGNTNGLAGLLMTVGWTGVAWMLAGFTASLMWLLRDLRGAARRDQARGVAWAAAAGLSLAAMLAPGGLNIPAVTLAAAVTWGMLPMMVGHTPDRRPGATLLAALGIFLMILAVGHRMGLAFWIASCYGGGPTALHVLGGFFLALMLGWLLGAAGGWRGLLALIVAVACGGLGEIVQGIGTSWRSVQMTDLAAHTAGCATAMIPYLLAVGARACESADAQPLPARW